MRGSTGVTNEPRRETVGELKSGPQERKPHLFLVQFCISSSRGWCSLASSKQSVGITKKSRHMATKIELNGIHVTGATMCILVILIWKINTNRVSYRVKSMKHQPRFLCNKTYVYNCSV